MFIKQTAAEGGSCGLDACKGNREKLQCYFLMIICSSFSPYCLSMWIKCITHWTS